MARPTRPTPSRRLPARMGMAALCGIALLGLLSWWGGPGPVRPTGPAAPPSPLPLPTAVAPPTTGGQEPLLDASQWAQLQSTLAQQPDGDEQTARIVEFLGYQRAVRALHGQRQAGTVDPALARRLDSELPAHLARGELSGPEATRLKATLLETLEPDPARRAQALADWRAELARAHPPAADPRDAQLMQAQQAILARWRATAVPGTPPDALLAELEAARQRIYVQNQPTGESR